MASGAVAHRPSTSPERPASKSPTAFRTIGEVATDLDLPQHVLRFWETKFPQLRPMKRAGGRRYYRPEDVALLRRIQALLYRDGFSIKGVQQVLARRSTTGADSFDGADTAEADVTAFPPPARPTKPAKPPLTGRQRAVLEDVRAELVDLKATLEELCR